MLWPFTSSSAYFLCVTKLVFFLLNAFVSFKLRHDMPSSSIGINFLHRGHWTVQIMRLPLIFVWTRFDADETRKFLQLFNLPPIATAIFLQNCEETSLIPCAMLDSKFQMSQPLFFYGFSVHWTWNGRRYNTRAEMQQGVLSYVVRWRADGTLVKGRWRAGYRFVAAW